jgi:hypothetical protein
MMDDPFWAAFAMLFAVAAFLIGYALVEIRERQRQNRELDNEAPSAKSPLSPAE